MSKNMTREQEKAMYAKAGDGKTYKKEYTATKDEEYNGWTNWDTWAVALWAENDQQFYTSKHIPWVKNIARKMKKGNYDQARMIPAIEKYYIKDAIALAKKNGDDIDKNKVNSKEITEHLEEQAKDMIRDGDI